LAGIAYWINARLHLPAEARVDKADRRVIAIKDWVDEQYRKGRITGISDDEMWDQARIHFPDWVASNTQREE
jgi:hypothetical protein